MPNHYHFALMSNYMYEHNLSVTASNKLTILENDGWTIVANSNLERIGSNVSYLGLAFYHEANQELVIANRGTILHGGLGNMLENIAIAENINVGLIIEPAWQFVLSVLNNRNIPQVENIYHTGHSLGGFIAQVNAARLTRERGNISSFAVTYDAPGAMAYMQSVHIGSNGLRTLNYLSIPNLVNTCHLHDGLRKRIYSSSNNDHFQFPLGQEINFIPNLGFPNSSHSIAAIKEIEQTFYSHSMESLLATFNQRTGLPHQSAFVSRWPCSVYRFFRSTTPPEIGINLDAIPWAGILFPLIGLFLEFSKQVVTSVTYNISSLNNPAGGIVSWHYTRYDQEQVLTDEQFYMLLTIMIAISLAIQQSTVPPNSAPRLDFI